MKWIRNRRNGTIIEGGDMSSHLKPGDRVRLTSADTMSGFSPGDEGTSKQGPHPAPVGGHYDIVQMDNDIDSGPAIVITDEFEPAD
jgi:hypothetical protein